MYTFYNFRLFLMCMCGTCVCFIHACVSVCVCVCVCVCRPETFTLFLSNLHFETRSLPQSGIDWFSKICSLGSFKLPLILLTVGITATQQHIWDLHGGWVLKHRYTCLYKKHLVLHPLSQTVSCKEATAGTEKPAIPLLGLIYNVLSMDNIASAPFSNLRFNL